MKKLGIIVLCGCLAFLAIGEAFLVKTMRYEAAHLGELRAEVRQLQDNSTILKKKIEKIDAEVSQLRATAKEKTSYFDTLPAGPAANPEKEPDDPMYSR